MNKHTCFTLAVLLILATSWSLGLAAPVPATADFWVRDQSGRITHACGDKEPLVLCMQGRKVVMQVQCDSANGLSYTARFFNLQKEVEKKQVLFLAGRESTPEVRVNDQQKVTVLSGGKTLMTGSGPAGKTYAISMGG